MKHGFPGSYCLHGWRALNFLMRYRNGLIFGQEFLLHAGRNGETKHIQSHLKPAAGID